MIFVTVGTSRNEKLVQYMDELSPGVTEPVIIQIGSGKYRPKNCEFFDFLPSLDEYFEKANIVVGSGGVGTTFDLLIRRKRFIAISNPDIPDRHQEQLLDKLSGLGYLIWCRDLRNLGDVLKQASLFKFKPYMKPECWIEHVILEHLRKSDENQSYRKAKSKAFFNFCLHLKNTVLTQ
ncbi:hypothetical protein K8R14_01545 [bacterium]|nr:hypothetical protein [bacterium]